MTDLTDEQAAMVQANLGLCGWAVQQWGRHLPTDDANTYSQTDAYQDAVFGLIRAVQKYDPATGYRFATYAAPWLRSAIQRGAGEFHGINYRRRVAEEGLWWAPVDAPVSLDADTGTEDGTATIADYLDDDHDHEAETIDRVLVDHIATLRHRVCTTDLDHALLNHALAHGCDRGWLATVARQMGMSTCNAAQRWTVIRKRIARLVAA